MPREESVSEATDVAPDASRSERPAVGEDSSVQFPRRTSGADGVNESFTFPKFEPDLTDPGADRPFVAGPTTARSASRRSRRRPWLLPTLLIALVAVQMIPSFLWLRERLRSAQSNAALNGAVRAPSLPSGSAPELLPGIAVPPPAVPRAEPTSGSAAGRPVEIARTVPGEATPTAVSGGALAVAAPLPVQVYLEGAVIGTSGGTIALSAGAHELEFVSEAVGYREKRQVSVQAGRITRLRLDLPKGSLSIDASPWAEVWIDGQRFGQTPIGDAEVAVGEREVVLRHPVLGERRTKVLVTLTHPTRVVLNMTQR